LTQGIQFHKLKSGLCKKKKRTGNPIPRDIEELDDLLRSQDIERQYKINLGNNVNQVDMYQGMVGTAPHRSLIFAHIGLITRLSTRKALYADATFYSVPNQPHLRQLLCIQTRYLGVVSNSLIFFINLFVLQLYQVWYLVVKFLLRREVFCNPCQMLLIYHHFWSYIQYWKFWFGVIIWKFIWCDLATNFFSIQDIFK
jgi:hypothetical protein